MRRLLAAAALAAVGLSLAIPVASAHDDPTHAMAWGASPNPTTANDGAQVYSNDEIVAASANFADGVRSWDVVIRPVNGGQPSTCHEDLAQENGRYPQKVYINCPWDTTRATKHTLPGATASADAANASFQRTWQSEDLGPSVNGKYTIEITFLNAGLRCGLVTGCRPDPDVVVEPHNLYQSGSNPPRWREVWVVNGVSDPTGVTNSYDAGANKVTVTWAPVPEPDVSYQVQEKVGDGKWGGGGMVPGNATRYERVVDQPGTYQYRVAAVRAAPTSDSGNGASATKRSGYAATSPVEIAQITPPSTAGAHNADGAPSDPGNPGVFVPEDPTSATTAPGSTGARPTKGTPTAGRSSGPAASGPRPAGASSRPTGTTAHEPGEAEGEGADTGFSAVLPYGEPRESGLGEDDGLGDENGPQTLAGGVIPKPKDMRQLVVLMAAGLMLFVFSMQIIVLLRRSRPAAVASAADDFDDWLGF